MNMAPFSTSCIEISAQAIKSNHDYLRKTMGKEVLLSAVVKGNAYGHGISTYIPLAEKAGYRHFSVFSDEEAWEVKAVCRPDTELLIMGQISEQGLAWCIQEDIGFFVFDFERLRASIQLAEAIGKAARIHIELETGMNRTGFRPDQLPELKSLLRTHRKLLAFEGLCTHFAGAESVTNYLRIKEQITLFHEGRRSFARAKIHFKQLHTACSAAALMFPETRMDMVRIGILQYGYWPSPEVKLRILGPQTPGKPRLDPLKRCIRWTSRVMSLQRVQAGDFVGYGTHFLAQRNMLLATVPVGYSQGYARSLSNQGRVIVRSQEVAVIGVVNMSLMIVDVSGIKNVQAGDEVVLIGRNGRKAVTVASFGEMSNQLNYELLTRMPRNIPRKAVL
jgi:alanine racemase